MLKSLRTAVKNWWILLIIGIICVIAGISVFGTLAAGTATLAIILSIVLLVDGVLGAIYIISNRKEIPAWGWDLILPILSVVAGIILLSNQAASFFFIVFFFAIGSMFKAIETICYAISMSSVKGSGWGWSLVAGILGFIISIFLFSNPLFTAVVINFVVAFALLFMGIESIVVSIQLSKAKSAIKKGLEE